MPSASAHHAAAPPGTAASVRTSEPLFPGFAVCEVLLLHLRFTYDYASLIASPGFTRAARTVGSDHKTGNSFGLHPTTFGRILNGETTPRGFLMVEILNTVTARMLH